MKKTALFLTLVLAAVSAVSCTAGDTAPESATESTTESATESVTESVTESAPTAASSSSEELDFSVLKTFDLASSDLHEGVWDSVITNTSNGSNRSPQLSWAPVEGASDYVVYMIDTTATNWVHWRSVTGGVTDLPAGWAKEKEYVGPYPPEGTHDYVIYVFALKEPANKVRGALNSSSPEFFKLIKSLDNDGGNILAYGTIKGTYTRGD